MRNPFTQADADFLRNVAMEDCSEHPVIFARIIGIVDRIERMCNPDPGDWIHRPPLVKKAVDPEMS